MQEKGRKKIALVVVIIIIFIPLLFINSFIIVDSLMHRDKAPGFIGYKPFIVYSGSMKNEIPVGSIAIIKEVDNKTLAKGDIIAFRTEDNSIVTHRIADVKTDDKQTYYITKGDQNKINDQQKVTANMIEGKYLFRIAYLGYLAMFLKEPLGLITVLLWIFLCFMICLFISKNDKHS